MTKIMSMSRQNKLKHYILISRGMQIALLNVLGFNHWLYGGWPGATLFISCMVILQFYIIALQTRVRRSRALYVKTYGVSQPKTETHFS